MSYKEVLNLPNGVYLEMLQSIEILQAQEQVLAYNAAFFGNPNLKEQARVKMRKDILKQASLDIFDKNKKEVSMKELAIILKETRG